MDQQQSPYTAPIMEEEASTVQYPTYAEETKPKQSSESEGQVILGKLKNLKFDWLSYLSFGIAIFFLFYSVIIFAIPCDKYNKIRVKHPYTTYFKIPLYVPALHFVTHICMIASFVALGFRKYTNETGCCQFWIFFSPFLVTGIFWIAYGAACGADFFFTDISSALSPDAFERFQQTNGIKLPRIVLTGVSPAYNASGYRKGSCDMSEYTLETNFAIHKALYPNISFFDSDVVYLKTEWGIEYDTRSEELSKQIFKKALDCAPYRIGRYTCRSWEISAKIEIPDIKINQFIIKTPQLPPEINMANKVLKGIFWAPAAFVYDVARLSPQGTAYITKVNTSLALHDVPDCSSFKYKY